MAGIIAFAAFAAFAAVACRWQVFSHGPAMIPALMAKKQS
jgi:hypothetical protein